MILTHVVKKNDILGFKDAFGALWHAQPSASDIGDWRPLWSCISAGHAMEDSLEGGDRGAVATRLSSAGLRSVAHGEALGRQSIIAASRETKQSEEMSLGSSRVLSLFCGDCFVRSVLESSCWEAVVQLSNRGMSARCKTSRIAVNEKVIHCGLKLGSFEAIHNPQPGGASTALLPHASTLLPSKSKTTFMHLVLSSMMAAERRMP